MQTTGINEAFFKDLQAEYTCLICQIGKSKLPFSRLFTFFDQNPKGIQTKVELKCESCESNSSTTYCLECNQYYCDECLDSNHKLNKKFLKHRFRKLELNETKSQPQCKCPKKQLLKMFCLKCKSAFCEDCIYFNHKKHPYKLLSEIYDENKQGNQSENKEILKKLLESFTEFQNTFIKNIQRRIESPDKEFLQLINDLFDLLKKYKEKHFENSSNDLQNIENQLYLMKNTLFFLSEEIEKNDLLQPSKLFFLNEFFPETSKSKNIFIKDFYGKINSHTLNNQQSVKLKQIEQILLEFYEEIYKKRFDGYLEKGEFSIVSSLSADFFRSNLFELLKKKPILLEKNSLYSNFNKSHMSTSFIVNDDSYIVWAGIKDNDNYFPLYIYNLSLMKGEKSIQKSTAFINVLGVYPLYASYDCKKWLYTGESNGILRIYSLNKENLFQEIQIIQTDNAIISVAIFEDKYNEIESNDLIKIYAIISFEQFSKYPIRIYKIKGERKEK